MTKNSTRKGLALGAALSLVGAGIAGTPAYAAPAITVALASGTSYSMISGEKLDLKVYSNSEFTFTNASDLQWEIVNSSAVTVTATTNNAGGSATTAATESPTATSTTITVDGGTAGVTAGANRLGLAVPADKTASLTVRAYIELDGTAGATAGDLISAPVTVSYIQAKDVVATVAVDAPYEDDTTVSASFSLNVNNEQLTAGDFAVYFTDGTGADLAGATVADADDFATAETIKAPAAWDADDKFVATSGTVTALDVDTAVKAVVYYNDGGVRADSDITADAGTDTDVDNDTELPLAQDPNDTDVNVALGNATASVAALTTGTVVVDAVNSTSANAATDKFAAGDTTFTLKATVKDATADTNPVVGATVYFTFGGTTVTLGTGADDKKLTINGTLYTNVDALPGDTDVAKVAAVTDADGVATVTVTTDNFANADAVKAIATYGTKASSEYTVTAETVAYELYVVNGDEIVTTTDGNAAVLSVEVRDQFGAFIADGYDVRANRTAAGQTTAGATGMVNNAAVVGGKASLSLLDGGTGTGDDTYTLTVEKRLNGGAYDTALASATITGFKVRIASAANLAANQVVLTTTTGDDTDTAAIERSGGALELADFGSYTSREVVGTQPDLDATVSISGTVKVKATPTSAAVNVAGLPVTATGAGLQFLAKVDQNGDNTDESIYSVGSIVTYTAADGTYDLAVSSNFAGKQSLTITVGSASQEVIIDFGAAAKTAGVSLTTNAPDVVLPGSTMTVVATLVDKYGNPVATADADNQIKFSWDGPGFVVSTPPQDTDANGQATIRVLMGANDSGTGTLTVQYDQNSNGAFTNDDDLTVQKTIQIGTPAVATWTKNLGSGEVKMYAKNIVGAGKVQFMLNGAEVAWVRAVDGTDPKLRSANGFYYLVRTVELVEGQKNVLEIYVDGVRTTRTAYTY